APSSVSTFPPRRLATPSSPRSRGKETDTGFVNPSTTPPAGGWGLAEFARARVSAALFGEETVGAPVAAAGRGEVEVDKAIEHRQFTAVQHGPEPARGVTDEIGDRHQAREQEGHRTGEKADEKQKS